nr:MAG TPA: hypothetical protein [Caudoviricetes sp.]
MCLIAAYYGIYPCRNTAGKAPETRVLPSIRQLSIEIRNPFHFIPCISFSISIQ